MGDNTDDGCCYIFTKYWQRIRTLGGKGDNTDDGAAATIIPNIDTEYITRIAYHVALSEFMEMKYPVPLKRAVLGVQSITYRSSQERSESSAAFDALSASIISMSRREKSPLCPRRVESEDTPLHYFKLRPFPYVAIDDLPFKFEQNNCRRNKTHSA